MARNRKSQSAALRFGPALKASVICLLIGSSGVGYVWQKDQLARLCQQRKVLEKRLKGLEVGNVKLHSQLSAMCTTDALQKQAKQFGLVQPQASQLVFLPEFNLETPEHNPPRQFASQNPGNTTMP